MSPYYADDSVRLYLGDCLDVLAEIPDDSVDAIVTDPPYGLEFMGKEWDSPWKRGDDINADAGIAATGYTDGGNRLPRPTFTGSTNPKCQVCGGTRRGRRDGTAKVKVCLCEDGGRFPNVRAAEMLAFQLWCQEWLTEALRVLKPGGHLLAFGGTRTWHRLAVAVEDAGFEVRDSIAWLYGSGFPKSLDVSKAIDKAAGATREVIGPNRHSSPGRSPGVMGMGGTNRRPDMEARLSAAGMDRGPETAPATPLAQQWQGWGTALKPAFEPIVVARKPLTGTVAANVLAHGTGALNVDGCRVGSTVETWPASRRYGGGRGDSPEASPTAFGRDSHGARTQATGDAPAGRWPANVLLDGDAAAELDEQSGTLTSGVLAAHHARAPKEAGILGAYGSTEGERGYGDTGGASRFFPTFRYEAKATTAERPRHGEVAHPTVKPLDLMRWLVRLVTPPGGTVLEPFAGSGTTAEACVIEGFRCIAIEREATYLPLIVARLSKPIQPDLFGGAA